MKKEFDGEERFDRSDESDRSDRSDKSADSSQPYRTLRPHGGYRRLRSFQVAQIVYDATVSFCDRFIDKRSRTHDQMVQAARSGKQNIAEGSRASATSSSSELHLVNVARSSLDELLLDYEDFLRQRRLPLWNKNDPPALKIRAVGRREAPEAADYARWFQSSDPAVVANTVVCLINQANYLLDQQIAALEKQFVEEGGYREQLHAARMEARRRGARNRTDQSDRSDQADKDKTPACPKCASPMVLRTARQGPRAGSHFWGCSTYPDCKGTRPADEAGQGLKGNGCQR